MNISNDAPPPANSDVSNQDANSNDTQPKTEPSTFSRVLAKKQAPLEGHGDLKKVGPGGESNPPLAGMLGGTSPFDQSLAAQKVGCKHVVELPPDLQNLVREIAVVSGGREVHIEMNSSALKGLHIRIEKQDGAVAIQFQCALDDTARLLSRNAEGLSQNLAERGISVADIRVSASQETSQKWSQKQRSKSEQQSGARSQSGRQGQR